ncbi:hypothetical protein B0H11DRAFT_2261897 [Mycena galericulata]|nr:hypothetical protein B0H11DRAFT_2261897 [Mycena galericulata]
MPASNIETVDHEWLVNEWPAHLRFLSALGISNEDQHMEGHQIVPRTYHGLRDWSYVGRKGGEHDMTRGFLLLYKDPPVLPNSPKSILYPVGVRVQGFIERCNFKPLGNWDTQRQPQTAIQFIVLSGGAHYGPVFSQYKSAVDEVIGFIHKCLSSRAPARREEEESMFIGRRVFTKITSRNRKAPSALEPGDDPMEFAKTVEPNWRVTSKPNVGMFLPDDFDPMDSATVPCDPVTLREGDFVDVCVGFDIVSRRERADRPVTHQVHLSIEHVLLLASAQDAETPAVEPEVTIQGPGISF